MSEKDMGRNEEEQDGKKGGGLFTKRRAKRAGVILAVLIVVVGGVAFMWNPVAAEVTNLNEFVANGAEITSEDGSVDGLGFGNRSDTPDSPIGQDRLTLQYEGLEDDVSVPVNFSLEVRGATDGETSYEGFGTGGTANTSFEELANGTSSFMPVADGGGLAGEANFSWNSAFTTATDDGSELIAVTNDSSIGAGDGHSAIYNANLSQDNDSETRLRELVVRLNATVVGNNTAAVPDGVNLTSSKTTSALIRVNNREAALVGDVADGIGGQGSMQLESNAVINETDNESVLNNNVSGP
jgi:hypothetical protein